MGIGPDELAKVLRGEAGVVECPFCGKDTRVSDLAEPIGCAGCSAIFGFLPGEIPKAEVVGTIASKFASLPALRGYGRIEKVKAVEVEGLARKHFALCMMTKKPWWRFW